jgi:REP element-mobilizing transposase RayT
MKKKFLNKYRSESARASWWDYANDGVYFITICTANRDWLFGEISNNEMFLSQIGLIVYNEWNISFDMRAELFCDNFVIMPNHIHAILRIENGINKNNDPVGTYGRASLQGDDDEQQQNKNTGVAYRSPKSISSFVAGFKSAATKQINEFRKTPKMPVWQSRFHDHIIRNNDEYQRIYNYIENNIQNWNNDKFFKTEA